jgi:hypothetical protein
MDIILHYMIIALIMYWFYKLRETANPFIFAGLICISLLALSTTVYDDTYITTGLVKEVTHNGGVVVEETTTVKTIPVGVFEQVLQAFYLMSMIGSVIYWVLSREKQLNY